MEIVYQVLFFVNNLLLFVISVAFSVQLIYMLLCFLPKRKYKEAEKQHRFAVVIAARNEREVIGETLKSLMRQDYPREKFDVFLVADNCTDDTAEIARSYGATVFERQNREQIGAGYAMRYLFEQLKTETAGYDAFIRLDADNLVDPRYITEMNKAFDSGVRLARGFNASKNFGVSLISGISSLWYMGESRFICNGRSRLKSTQMLSGANMMFSSELIQDGWQCVTLSEDAEFTMDKLFEGVKADYVPEAIVYVDHPTTFKDIVRRNLRLGNALNKLFFSHGVKSLGKFFTTFSFAYLDMFLYLLFVPIAVLCCTWVPAYYVFDVVYNVITGNFGHVYELGFLIAMILSFSFLLPFILQATLICILERKKIKLKTRKLILPVLVYPLFMIIYAVSITVGVMQKPNWKKVGRSKVSISEIDNGK